MEKDKKYIAGFNTGYFLTKYEFGLVTILLKNLSLAGDFLQGFSAGREQLEFDNNLEHLSQLLKIRNEKDRDLMR